MKKIIVGSSIRLGLKFIRALPKEYEIFVIATDSAAVVSQKEENFKS